MQEKKVTQLCLCKHGSHLCGVILFVFTFFHDLLFLNVFRIFHTNEKKHLKVKQL